MSSRSKRKTSNGRKYNEDDYDYVNDDDDDYVYEDDVEKPAAPVLKFKKAALTTISSSSSMYIDNDDPHADVTQNYFGSYQDLSKSLTLKQDHEKRPIWIAKNNIIILEAFSKYYTQAYDFLIDIAEPISRPTYFQTYQLTEDSLYSAVAVSRSTESIIKYLNILCKTEVPVEVIDFIKSATSTFGKAKLVLKNNVFHVESHWPDVLRELLKNPIIKAARTNSEIILDNTNNPVPPPQPIRPIITSTITPSVLATAPSSAPNLPSFSLPALASGANISDHTDNNASSANDTDGFLVSSAPREDRREVQLLLLDEDGDEDNDADADADDTVEGIDAHSTRDRQLRTVSFTVSQDRVQAVKRSAKSESRYPLLEEYDFRADLRNPPLTIDLRPSTLIRPYQEKSLSKMFGNGRARSGIIVLPCGAGKTLTGVTAASTVKKATIVLCINNASVKQWKEQFMLWTTVQEKSIRMFTSGFKELLPDPKEACVLITTYSMICHSGRRSDSAQLMMRGVTEREWGLMVLDEVHVAPADMFQKVLQIVNAHCKLGLTATLVREDNKIKDLSFLVGPKLYEANWIDLTNQQYLARAQCVEVWCPMTKDFYAEYIRCGMNQHSRMQQLLYLLNPRKLRVCEYLVRYHIKRNDKIIIFSDDLPALYLYCTLLKSVAEIPYICGETKEEDRRKYLTTFKSSPAMNCIGLSKVGDTALDIPEANVIIQISSHFGARRQEAQRLGRILRPKASMLAGQNTGFNAFFYSLVSSDTREMYFSAKRQQYLVDQGYTFKVVQDLADRADKESTVLCTQEQELHLLEQALKFKVEAWDAVESTAVDKSTRGEVEGDEEEVAQLASKVKVLAGTTGGAKRKTGSSLGALSGADGTVYSEFQVKK